MPQNKIVTDLDEKGPKTKNIVGPDLIITRGERCKMVELTRLPVILG